MMVMMITNAKFAVAPLNGSLLNFSHVAAEMGFVPHVATPGPLSFMDRVSPATYFYQPQLEHNDDIQAPDLIVIFSWMAARERYIAKYVRQHQAVFPSSRILLIRNLYDHNFWEPKARSDIRPAVDLVAGLVDSPSTAPSGETKQPRILIHIFSNGGIFSAARFFELFKERSALGIKSFPPYASVIDSSPTYFSWTRIHRALVLPLPFILTPFIHVLMAFLWLWCVLLRQPDPLARKAAVVNGAGLVGKEVRRTYIYSEEDDIVDWKHIEDHASQAARGGFRVRKVKFVGSKHVAHARMDNLGYWSLIRSTWTGLC